MRAKKRYLAHSGNPQGDVVFLVLRRMRFPLLLLVTVIWIGVIGFTIIPGVGPDGEPTEPMSAFEALYVVLYTATTIGFGEIPGTFSTGQRMWMIMVILFSVSTWTFSVLNVLALVQDRTFLNSVQASRFAAKMRGLRQPFYIVCGAGETGALLMHGLDHSGFRFVVVDNDEAQISKLRLDNFETVPLAMVADAGEPSTLLGAGLLNPNCRGVVALASDDAANRAIAVTVRLLAPKVPVLARVRDESIETHVGVFGGDVVVNPFKQFASSMVTAISRPQRHLLRQTLIGLPGESIDIVEQPPTGHWIVCGYGRQGKEMTKRLREAGMDVSVVDDKNFLEGEVMVNGAGTSSDDLRAAGIDEAVGIVTATDSDTKNLAIAVMARALRHEIFLVVRQNRLGNTPLFDAADYDLLLDPSRLVAQEFFARMTTPLLGRFLRYIEQLSEPDCAKLSEQLAVLEEGNNPHLWDLALNEQRTPAVIDRISQGHGVTVGHLITDPDDWAERLPAMVLMVRRGSHNVILPDDDFELEPDDRLLFAGSQKAMRSNSHLLVNINDLNYVQTGVSQSGAWISRLVNRNNPALRQKVGPS